MVNADRIPVPLMALAWCVCVGINAFNAAVIVYQIVRYA